MVEVAYAISPVNRPNLKKFFRMVQAKKGYNVAAVALARKCYAYSSINDELEVYQKDDAIKTKSMDTDIALVINKYRLRGNDWSSCSSRKCNLKDKFGCMRIDLLMLLF